QSPQPSSIRRLLFPNSEHARVAEALLRRHGRELSDFRGWRAAQVTANRSARALPPSLSQTHAFAFPLVLGDEFDAGAYKRVLHGSDRTEPRVDHVALQARDSIK